MNRKTQAQRDAINARAFAYGRPLSSHQIAALKAMGRRQLVRCVAGWSNSSASRQKGIEYWASQTVYALEKRGLCTLNDKRFFAMITPAGRRELARHRGIDV